MHDLYDGVWISHWSFTDAATTYNISTEGPGGFPSDPMGYKKKSSLPTQSILSNKKTPLPSNAMPRSSAQVTHLPDRQRDRPAACAISYNDKYSDTMDVSFRNNCK